MTNVSPARYLKTVMKTYPAMSSWVQILLEGKGKDGAPDWPNWCFLPMGAWGAMINTQSNIGHEFAKSWDVTKGVGVLSAIGTWRYSQGIYRLDADLLAALAETELSGDLPAELFHRLPEWCVYVETPGLSWLDSSLHGFWAHLEWDIDHRREELRFVLNTDQGLVPQPLHLGKWSIEEAITKTLAFTTANGGGLLKFLGLDSLLQDPLAQELKSLVSILLYLCSEEPDIDPMRMPQSTPSRQVFRKGKKGKYLYTPEKPKVFRVGDRVGRLLRNAAEAQVSGRTVKTHLRRGHWHGFWTGPRSGERIFIYRWIAPLVVEGRDAQRLVEEV